MNHKGPAFLLVYFLRFANLRSRIFGEIGLRICGGGRRRHLQAGSPGQVRRYPRQTRPAPPTAPRFARCERLSLYQDVIPAGQDHIRTSYQLAGITSAGHTSWPGSHQDVIPADRDHIRTSRQLAGITSLVQGKFYYVNCPIHAIVLRVCPIIISHLQTSQRSRNKEK